MQYNGEYAREGEEWPPAEAFIDEPEEAHLSARPSQQATSTSRPSVSQSAGVRQTRSAQEVASYPVAFQAMCLYGTAVWVIMSSEQLLFA